VLRRRVLDENSSSEKEISHRVEDQFRGHFPGHISGESELSFGDRTSAFRSVDRAVASLIERSHR
jgi:hypothetical protein